jgi:Flp pilus assembly pilin Flp
VIRRMFRALSRVTHRVREEVGQTTAEYALVILGAAALATLLITWATKSHAVGKLFDEVIGKVLP